MKRPSTVFLRQRASQARQSRACSRLLPVGVWCAVAATSATTAWANQDAPATPAPTTPTVTPPAVIPPTGNLPAVNPPTDAAPTATPAPGASPTPTTPPAPTATPTRDSVPPLPGPQQNPPLDEAAATPVTRIENPNAILPPPPAVTAPLTPGAATVGATPTPTATPSPASAGLPTSPLVSPGKPPAPTNGLQGQATPTRQADGSVTGQEVPGGNGALDSPNGIIYDQENGLAIAQGDVTFTYGEFRVRADRGIYDENTQIATLAGNLTVEATYQGQKQSFTGKTLSFNNRTGQWLLSNIEKTFPPELFPPGTVLEPLYVREGNITGLDDTVRGNNFKFTSCLRNHYYLRSNRLEFYRTPSGEPSRVVLRKNALYILGRKVLPLPVYSASLLGQTARRQPIQATAGQNEIDGYFVRTLYNFQASQKATNSLLIDGLQKRGLGLGIQRELAAGGLFYLYAVSGQNGGREVNARVNKTYQFAPGYRANVRFDSSTNNSVTGSGISSQNGDLTLTRQGKRAQSTGILSFDRSAFSSSTSDAQTLSLDHRQDFGAGYSLQVRSQLNQATTSTGIATDTGIEARTMDSELQLSKSSRQFDMFLRAEMHDDLVQDRTYQLERLPELTFQSDATRLGLPLLKDFLPGNFTLSYGRFTEPNYGGDTDLSNATSRADFFYNARPKSYRLLGNGNSTSVLTMGGSFEQAFYGFSQAASTSGGESSSDDSARYNYAYNASLTNTLKNLRFQMNYAKQRTYGYTPLSFDFFTPGEYLDYTLSYQRARSFRFNLSGGRDVQNGFNRDIISTVQWAPTDSFYASVGTSYILEGDRFGDIYGNFRLNGDRRRFLGGSASLGFRYTPSGSNAGLTRVNSSFDVQLGKGNRLQALVGYDGNTRKFDFSQYRFTRDLHCFNLFMTYDGQRNELRFDLALKAFPFTDTRFGRNQFSEGFDASVGGIR